MPRGANAKREREYRELKREFKKEGRYKGRQEEVAARIVNKQRSRFGETESEKRKDEAGRSPDRDLPVPHYQHKTADQIERAIPNLSRGELKKLEHYEKEHKNRKTVLQALHQRMNGHGGHSRRSASNRASRGTAGNSSRHKSSKRSARSSAGKSKSSRSRGTHDRHSSDGEVTIDHDEIRRWVEERGGHPATVRSTIDKSHKPGILRVDFPGYSGQQTLEKISWPEFFDKFDRANLAFLHQDRTTSGKRSRFSKLVSR